MVGFIQYLHEEYLPEGYTFKTVGAKDAESLLQQYHYLGRLPRATKLVCAVFEDGNPDPIAAVFFGIPARHWDVPILELTRLVRTPSAKISLTELVAFVAKQIKQNKNLPQLLISYADPAAGHHGGIYQAASWNFHDKQKDYIDGAVVDGTFVPWRTLRHRYGTSSANQIKLKFPELDIKANTTEGKYLYWRALDNKAERDAKIVGLRRNPYPKPTASNP